MSLLLCELPSFSTLAFLWSVILAHLTPLWQYPHISYHPFSHCFIPHYTCLETNPG